MPTPDVLHDRVANLTLQQTLNYGAAPTECTRQVALHSLWNLDPTWRNNTDWQHVLFIERQQIEAWPMSPLRWAFVDEWAKRFGFEIWLDDVNALEKLQKSGTRFVRKEYPACNHWPGDVDMRRFYYQQPEQPFNSFSQFWKQVKS